MRGIGFPMQAKIDKDSFIKGLSEPAQAIKNKGSICSQWKKRDKV